MIAAEDGAISASEGGGKMPRVARGNPRWLLVNMPASIA